MPRRWSRREAVGIARGVAALQSDLVGALAVELDEELGVELEGAVVVELDNPAVDALGVELRVPRGVQRVGQVHALAVAADLDHLRAAVDGGGGRGRRAPADAADAHAAGLARLVGRGDVVALELAGAPAGDEELLVVD